MDFKITIDDPTLLAGITYVRELSNTGRAEDEQFGTDEDYISWVMTEAVKSYARDKAAADRAAAISGAEVGDFAKLDALRADLAATAAAGAK